MNQAETDTKSTDRSPTGSDVSAGFVMRVSLGASVLLMGLKIGAYFWTGSVAILGDALESCVHLAAVIFGTLAVTWVARPADESHPYGHAKITSFSTGFEGGMILVAAGFIIFETIHRWGATPSAIGAGLLFTTATIVVNCVLGGWILWQGRRKKSSILISNGKHTLVDVWTSTGVVVGLLMTKVTGWAYWDGLCALAVALNIIWTGTGLVREAIHALLDTSLPAHRDPLVREVTAIAHELGLEVHSIRHRPFGDQHILDCHVGLDESTTLLAAHDKADGFEKVVRQRILSVSDIFTHIEPRSRALHF